MGISNPPTRGQIRVSRLLEVLAELDLNLFTSA